MMSPPTECFYMLHLEGEAAEFASATLSPSTINDIREAVLISLDFTNDIQAANSMDEAMELVREELKGFDLIEYENFNPLWLPSTPEQLDTVFDGEPRSESVTFTGVDGSPFTMKLVGFQHEDRELLKGKLACKPFELPAYSEIVLEHKNLLLN